MAHKQLQKEFEDHIIEKCKKDNDEGVNSARLPKKERPGWKIPIRYHQRNNIIIY